MPLLIPNEVVEAVVEMPAALDAMEDALGQFAAGDAVINPRTAMWSPNPDAGDYYRWSCQLGSISRPPRAAIRFKSEVISWEEHPDGTVTESRHNVSPGTYMGVIQLFDTTDGALVGIVHDGVVQHVRTATTAGIACKHLARPDAAVVGLLGSGGMAETYLRAFDHVRDLSEVRVYSPTEANRRGFASAMAAELDLDVAAVTDPAAAVGGADIAATCTNSLTPVFDPSWLEPGQFVVNVAPVEIPASVLEAADRTFTTRDAPGVDHVIGSAADRERISGYYPEPAYTDYVPLIDVVSGDDPGRRSADEVLFHQNVAIGGLQFTAIASVVHALADERDLGFQIPIEWFQETVKS